MTTAPDLLARRRARGTALRRRVREERVLVGLVLLTVVLTVLCALERPWIAWFPLASLTVPLLVGSLMLAPRALPWYVVFVMAMLTVAASRQPLVTDTDAAAIAVYFLLGLITLLLAFRRARLGVAGWQGESMFLDLRDRILHQGADPLLPEGWHAESAIAPAGGTDFAGDFVVVITPEPGRLEVAVVDVSGNGAQAGTRALHLSGAFGGMLGAVPPEEFLAAANDYLIRQDWDEGFATAAHLTLDLGRGEFCVRTAGHPPALLRSASGADSADSADSAESADSADRASTGGWSALESGGPLLGLIEGAEFAEAEGTLHPGDALLLYTDGMVEKPRRDIEVGIDRLLVAADVELARGVAGAATRLVRSVGAKGDDRAVVLVSRD